MNKEISRQFPRAVTGLFIILLALTNTTVLAADKESLGKTESSAQAHKPPQSSVRNIIKVTTPVLESFQILDIVSGAQNQIISYKRQVHLAIDYSGTKPSHYRVSENTNLYGAQWRTFTENAKHRYTFQQDADGQKNVYAQLRYGTSDQFQSNIKYASINYRKPPIVNNFLIENGAANASKRQVILKWDVVGTASNYRVSESADMTGVSWNSGGSPPSGNTVFDLAEGAAGARTLYLQVKREQSDPVSASDSINISVGICPIGHRGLECSGAGVCSAAGQCICNPDIRGTACKTIVQTCYGAAGNNCGPADGIANFGLCAYTPLGPSCKINAGSWEHDECCIRHRLGGPNPQQGSCTAPGLGPPPYYCQDLLAKAVLHIQHPELSWTRYKMDFGKKYTRTEEIEMPVTHLDMCNESGGTLLCSDVQYCCSRSGRPPLVFAPSSPAVLVMGPICVCD